MEGPPGALPLVEQRPDGSVVGVIQLGSIYRVIEKSSVTWRRLRASQPGNPTIVHERPEVPAPPISLRRTPDIQTSRERIKMVDKLAYELAIIKPEVQKYCTVETLKQKYPKFTLWTIIEDSQIKELVEGEPFSPKAFAELLTLNKYGLTSRETLKKDRRKLRKAKGTAAP
jgi:hypothetical protein